MSGQSFVLSDDVLESIRLAARNADSPLDVVDAVVNELLQADLDLRREPTLEQMKQLLVAACRERRDPPVAASAPLQTVRS